MGIESLTDESVLRLYENIRQQVEADVLLGSGHRLLRETAKQEAERLRAELDRRRLKYDPIDWRQSAPHRIVVVWQPRAQRISFSDAPDVSWRTRPLASDSVLLAKPKPDAGEREYSGEYAQNRFEVSGGAVVQP